MTVIFWHNVPKDLTSADEAVLQSVLPDRERRAQDICAQIEQIRKIQHLVLADKNYKKIPQGSTREPADFFSNRGGLCYDRSRAFEKALRYNGYVTRHVSLYKSAADEKFPVLHRGSPSHATTEIKTEKGWLAADSYSMWLAADQYCKVFAVKDLATRNESISYTELDTFLHKYYRNPDQIVYGLYSRHGKFYPPYTFIPDYNLSELCFNLTE